MSLAKNIFWIFILGIFIGCQKVPLETTHTVPYPQFSATYLNGSVNGVFFANIGDYGAQSPAQMRVSQLIDSLNPHLIITSGDNVYPYIKHFDWMDNAIGPYYAKYIFPYKGKFGPGARGINRFYPSLGNHDWYYQGWKVYLEYFELPGNERYYDFTWGDVHFFSLNSEPGEPDGIRANSRQALWLKEKLASSDKPWKIVYFHKPPYSSGVHGPTRYMRWPFAEWGVDMVLTGHEHHYERLEIDGVTYIINGVGGAGLRPIPHVADGSIVRFNQQYGAFFAYADRHRLVGFFVTIDYQVVDWFVLEK